MKLHLNCYLGFSRKHWIALLSVITAGVLVSSQAAAQPLLLLSDDFERTTGNSNPDGGAFLSDWGENDNAQGGTITQTYITTPTRTSGGGVNQTVQEANDPVDGDNEGVIRFGAITVDHNLATDANVLEGGGFTVEFTGHRVSGAFLSFHLGTDPNLVATTSGGAAFLPVTSVNDAGEHAYIYQAGDFADLRMQVYESGVKLEPPGNIDFVTSDDSAQFTSVVTVLAPDGFDIGDTLDISVSVDGTDVTSAAHSVNIVGNFPGYIGWSSNSGGALIDDLKITALGTATGGLDGDYNDDGVVDAADYTTWRDNLGQSVTLPNDTTAGTVTTADYDVWKSAFGNTSGSGAGSAVPEPTTAMLLLLTMVSLIGTRRRS